MIILLQMLMKMNQLDDVVDVVDFGLQMWSLAQRSVIGPERDQSHWCSIHRSANEHRPSRDHELRSKEYGTSELLEAVHNITHTLGGPVG
jgi:hypothetical protein